MFTTAESAGFYDVIGDRYDQSLSDNYKKTLAQTATHIAQLAKGKPIRVLDVGGGTGALLRHLPKDSDVQWTYCDASSVMLNRFKEEFPDQAYDAQQCSFDFVHRVFEKTTFDVIILSFLMSSLPVHPDLSSLGKLLKPGGRIIVVDANPIYSALRPHFEAHVGRDVFALKINPVNTVSLISDLQRAGFMLEKLDPVWVPARTFEPLYAFIGIFIKDGSI